MTPIRIIAPSLLAFALYSCAPDKADKYDTANPYGTPPVTQTPAAAPTNPVYDSQAAYEESTIRPATTGTPAVTSAAVPAVPSVPATPAVTPAPAVASAYGSGTIHTVVKGDTLSGISAKYKVPTASIKQANHMTNDVVVLGRKMVIPPR